MMYENVLCYRMNSTVYFVALFVVTHSVAVEHSLFLAFTINFAPKSYSLIDAIILYQKGMFQHVFKYVEYNIVIGGVLQVSRLPQIASE